MSDYILTTDKLKKTYSKVNAVNEVDMHIKKGSIYGLIGKNGAGKTTIMKMVGGLARPTSGKINFEGFSNNKEAYKKIGTVIEDPALYKYLNAHDNIKLKCLAYGIEGSDEYIDEKLALVGLKGVTKRVSKYSLGMKQRLGIALALVGDPEFLLLDEPINGLDPQAIVEVRKLFEVLNREKGITILISSHILEELSKLVTQIAIIDKGNILVESTIEELEKKAQRTITIKTKDTEKVCEILKSMNLNDFTVVGDSVELVHSDIETSAINTELAKQGVSVDGIGASEFGLEEYYLKLTSKV